MHGPRGEVVPAPKATLDPGGVDQPALEGSARGPRSATAAEVEVRPVMVLLREMLDRDYTPEQDRRKLCGIHPDTTRMLARKVAAKRTRFLMGWNSGKYYHGDLMERSMSPAAGSHRQLGQARHRAAQLGRRPQRRNVQRDDEGEGHGPDSVGVTTMRELRDNIAAGRQDPTPHRRDGGLQNRADDDGR